MWKKVYFVSRTCRDGRLWRKPHAVFCRLLPAVVPRYFFPFVVCTVRAVCRRVFSLDICPPSLRRAYLHVWVAILRTSTASLVYCKEDSPIINWSEFMYAETARYLAVFFTCKRTRPPTRITEPLSLCRIQKFLHAFVVRDSVSASTVAILLPECFVLLQTEGKQLPSLYSRSLRSFSSFVLTNRTFPHISFCLRACECPRCALPCDFT